MIKKLALALTLTLAAVAPLATPASAADEPVREIIGHGLDACPEHSLCLYQDRDYNGTEDARIWIITGSVERLSAYDANDRASSLYLNSRKSATLYGDAEYKGDNFQTFRRDRLADLNRVSGRSPGVPHAVHLWMNDSISSVWVGRDGL
ncbi:peptidase inhibitor family I36 protein [Streptomyces niveus]|uniref:peptidase inhibitor family I36 protein n=1 Tax=Streptomyces niveus TaxID=193462 RepID=UPI0035D768D2